VLPTRWWAWRTETMAQAPAERRRELRMTSREQAEGIEDGAAPASASWFRRHGDRILPLLAAALLIGSLAMPYWTLNLHAPQYPRGLHVTVFLNRAIGDIHELNGLNHYIGMAPLDSGAAFERSISFPGVAIVGLLAAVVVVRRRWVWLAALPALLLPIIFAGDLAFWLYKFGHELDPHAALSNSIHPFTPPVLGPGKVGQFRTLAYFNVGFWMAFLAASLLGVTMWLRRQQSAASSGDR
jgi:copper chaperone NosL